MVDKGVIKPVEGVRRSAGRESKSRTVVRSEVPREAACCLSGRFSRRQRRRRRWSVSGMKTMKRAPKAATPGEMKSGSQMSRSISACAATGATVSASRTAETTIWKWVALGHDICRVSRAVLRKGGEGREDGIGKIGRKVRTHLFDSLDRSDAMAKPM